MKKKRVELQNKLLLLSVLLDKNKISSIGSKGKDECEDRETVKRRRINDTINISAESRFRLVATIILIPI